MRDMTAAWAYALDQSGALVSRVDGDDLLARLIGLGFPVRRYGDQAAIDDDSGQGSVPSIEHLHEFADRQQNTATCLSFWARRTCSWSGPKTV